MLTGSELIELAPYSPVTPDGSVPPGFASSGGLSTLGRALDATRLPTWRKARAGVLSGTANALVCAVGDSTTDGAQSSGAFSPKNVTWHLAQKLAASNPLLFSNQSSFAGDPGLAGFARHQVDPRFTFTGTVTQGSASLGGPILTLAAGATVTFTPGTAFDTAVIQFFNGSISATVTGGSATTGTTGFVVGQLTATTASASASNALTITATGGTLSVMSVQTFNSAQKSVNIMNCGYYGGLVSGICAGPNPAFSPVTVLTQLAPALTILNVGINDWNAGTSVTALLAAIQPFVAAAQLSGDVVLAIGIPNANNLPLQAAYLTALATYAQSAGIPFVDFQTRWQSFAFSNALGNYADALHPTAAYGMPDIAQAYFNLLSAV